MLTGTVGTDVFHGFDYVALALVWFDNEEDVVRYEGPLLLKRSHNEDNVSDPHRDWFAYSKSKVKTMNWSTPRNWEGSTRSRRSWSTASKVA